MDASYFTVDPAGVISERFDDEVIAINLNRGTYYSMNQTAAEIFELAAQQPSLDDILTALLNRYDAPWGEVETQVVQFLSELEGEGLIGRTRSRSETPPPSLPAAAQKTPFLAPSFAVHRDMQDLFLLDPIHEVGEAGWPQKQESARAEPER